MTTLTVLDGVTVKVFSTNTAGESFADAARRLGSINGVSVASNATDAQVMTALANSQIASLSSSITTATSAATAAALSASAAATSAGLAAGNAGSGLYAYNALSGFVGTTETVGIAPATDTAGTANVLIFMNTPSTYDSTLDSFKVSIRSVGNGTARLVVALSIYGTNQVAILHEINLTGIAATGVQTFTAGVDYPIPTNADGQPIVFPAGCRVALGSATGGVVFDTQVSTGAGIYVAANANGYSVTQNPGINYIGKFQVTWGRVKSVRAAIDQVPVVAQPGETLITEYNGPDSLLFTSVGNQTRTFPYGNNLPFYNDGKITGVQYCAVSAGDVIWVVYRGNVIVDWRRTTVTATDQTTVIFATPFNVKAGDKLDYIPISGYMKSQNFSAVPGRYPATNMTFSAASFTTFAGQPAFRAVTQRMPKPKAIAARSSRGSTMTFDQRFRGTVLPGNTTFTATTTNGSNTLTGITGGTALPLAFVSGTGLNALLVPFIVSVSGTTALMSQPATASGTVTITQTGWASGGTGTWTQNDGLISPSSASTDWARRYVAPWPINAQRRTFVASVYVGDLTNIGGLCTQAQQASNVTTLGSVIHIDAPANKGRLYKWGGNTGTAPNDAGLEVVLPWTLAATDWVVITTQIERGRQTVVFTNAKTGVSSTPIVSTWNAGGVGPAIHGGVFSGQPGAHFLQGNGGMKWDYMRNITHVASSGPRVFWAGDSTHHIVSDNFDYSWVARLEDDRGKGDFLNFAKAAQTAVAQLVSLPMDFAAMSPGFGDELFWGIGVNPDNDLGSTDALRYASYKRSTQAVASLCNLLGVRFTPVTPTPANYISTYVALLVSNILAYDLGSYPVVDVGRAVSSSGDGANWTPLYSIDNLHPFEPTGAPVIKANFVAQRPDMNGSY